VLAANSRYYIELVWDGATSTFQVISNNVVVIEKSLPTIVRADLVDVGSISPGLVYGGSAMSVGFRDFYFATDIEPLGAVSVEELSVADMEVPNDWGTSDNRPVPEVLSTTIANLTGSVASPDAPVAYSST